MSKRTLLCLGAVATCVLLGGASCGPELEPIARISGIRIIGVRKSAPYARPGETVRLHMLWEDGGDEPPRDAQAFFAFWCVNPPGGLFSECLQQAPTITPTFSIGSNTTDITIPEDTLRPSASSPDAPPGGMAFVFYGVCAGHLRIAGNSLDGWGGGAGFAVGGAGPTSDAVSDILEQLADSGELGSALLPECVDDDGQPLGSDDFIIGYSTIFIFDELRNEHPVISDFRVAGESVAVDCVDDACDAPFEIPDLDACVPGVACFDACEEDGAPSCPDVELLPTIPESSAEVDEYAREAYGDDLTESVWVSYFVDRGGLSADVRLVNDPTTGWSPDQASGFRAPREPGPVRIWAAVRDNRGGVSWARIPGYVK